MTTNPDRSVPTPQEIKAARLRERLSQERLAHVLGVSKPTVIAWERGKSRPQLRISGRVRDFVDRRIAPPTSAEPPAPSPAGPEPDPLDIAARLARFRAENSLRQEDLAEAFDVSVASVSQWESGTTRPTGARLEALLKLLNGDFDAPKLLAHEERRRLAEERRRSRLGVCRNPSGCHGSDEGGDDPIFRHYLKPRELSKSRVMGTLDDVRRFWMRTDGEVARLLGVPTGRVAGWRAGKYRPSPRVWAVLVRALLDKQASCVSGSAEETTYRYRLFFLRRLGAEDARLRELDLIGPDRIATLFRPTNEHTQI